MSSRTLQQSVYCWWNLLECEGSPASKASSILHVVLRRPIKCRARLVQFFRGGVFSGVTLLSLHGEAYSGYLEGASDWLPEGFLGRAIIGAYLSILQVLCGLEKVYNCPFGSLVGDTYRVEYSTCSALIWRKRRLIGGIVVFFLGSGMSGIHILAFRHRDPIPN